MKENPHRRHERASQQPAPHDWNRRKHPCSATPRTGPNESPEGPTRMHSPHSRNNPAGSTFRKRYIGMIPTAKHIATTPPQLATSTTPYPPGLFAEQQRRYHLHHRIRTDDPRCRPHEDHPRETLHHDPHDVKRTRTERSPNAGFFPPPGDSVRHQRKCADQGQYERHRPKPPQHPRRHSTRKRNQPQPLNQRDLVIHGYPGPNSFHHSPGHGQGLRGRKARTNNQRRRGPVALRNRKKHHRRRPFRQRYVLPCFHHADNLPPLAAAHSHPPSHEFHGITIRESSYERVVDQRHRRCVSTVGLRKATPGLNSRIHHLEVLGRYAVYQSHRASVEHAPFQLHVPSIRVHAQRQGVGDRNPRNSGRAANCLHHLTLNAYTVAGARTRQAPDRRTETRRRLCENPGWSPPPARHHRAQPLRPKARRP